MDGLQLDQATELPGPGRLAMRAALPADTRTCLLLRYVATMRAEPGDVLFQTVMTG